MTTAISGKDRRPGKPKIQPSRTKFDLWLERCRESGVSVCLEVIPGANPSGSMYSGNIITVDRYFVEILPRDEDGSYWVNKGMILTARMDS
jgi:hypothetical protein